MNSNHLIDSAVFDITFSQEESALALQSELDSFVKNQLMNVVEQVFDRSSGPDSVYRITALEIDLGDIPYHDYRQEMPKRLRERLEEILADLRVSRNATKRAQVSLVDRDDARHDWLKYFLQHGYLPWHARLSANESPEQLLEEFIAARPAELVAFLRAVPGRVKVIERLTRQFPRQIVDQVLQTLAPFHAAEIRFYIAELAQRWQYSDAQVKSLFIESGEVVRLVSQQLIAMMLEAYGQQVNSDQLLQQAMNKVLYDKLRLEAGALTKLLKKSSRHKQGSRGLDQILENLIRTGPSEPAAHDKRERVPQTNAVSDEKEVTTPSKLEALRSRLIEALLSGNNSAIGPVWSTLYHDHAAMLEEALRHYGQHAKVRHNIATGFADILLQDILVLLEPEHHGFIGSVLEHARLIQPQQQDDLTTAAAHKRQMWEFSLAYLLVERGSRFNKKSYLNSLLGQMAVARNMSRVELLGGIQQNLSTIAMENPFARHLLEFLSDMSPDVRIEPEKTEQQDKTQVQSYVLYETLKHAMITDIALDDEATLVNAIETLRRSQPWLLLRLLRELQAGQLPWTAALKTFQTGVSRSLVHAFVSLSQQIAAGEQSDLAKAIESGAARSKDQSGFYRKLLGTIIRHELIDFDAVETGSAEAVTVAEESDRVEARQQFYLSSKALQVEALTADQAEKMFSSFVSIDQALSAQQAVRLFKSIEVLLAKQPRRLAQLLESGIQNKTFIDRLVHLLPEWLLRRLFTLLASAGWSRLLNQIELVGTACYGNEIALGLEQLKLLKWRFLFAYLADTGPLFNEHNFIRRYVQTLIPHSRCPDQQRFHTALSQQLVADALPSTRESIQTIIASLARSAGQASGSAATARTNTPEPAAAEDEQQLPLEDIYIHNAGLVLAAPYLPHLLDRLGLMEKSVLKNREAAERAVHLLQYLVNESSNSPEYQLVLNKLLCGVKTGIPIRREIEVSANEKEIVESLLQGMIQNWKAIANTSIAGLRESFLQRNARLQLKDDAWHLAVEAKPYDMLLDQIPWSYSTIKYVWMERVIYVDWR